MKFRKWLIVTLSLVMAVAVGLGIAACGMTPVTETEYVTVTWYDGTKVISENKQHVKGVVIKESEKPSASLLEKDGFTFDDWYAEAACETKFDFSKVIDKNTDIYGKWTDNSAEPAEHVHQYGAWTVTEQPTAEKTGKATRTCTAADCDDSAGKTQEQTLPVLTDTRYTVTENSATCQAAGTGKYSIELGGTTFTFEAATKQLEHSYGGWQSDATGHWKICSVGGEEYGRAGHDDKGEGGACSVCGYKAGQMPAEHVHQYGAWTVMEQPAAEKTGKATRTCTAADCDDSAEKTQEETLPALNEEDYTLVHTQVPTCTGAGTDTYTYTFSDQTTVDVVVTVDPTGHTYGQPTWNWTGSDAEGYTAATATFSCEKEDDVQTVTADKIDVKETSDSCTTNKVYTADVSFGGQQYHDSKTVVLTGQHTYGQLIEQQEATCTADGVKAHYHCEKCNKDFLERNGVEASEEDLKIAALGHDYTESEWVVTAPTASAPGKAEKTCSRANGDEAHEKHTITLPALSEENGYTVKGAHSCTQSYTLTYEITLEEHLFYFTETKDPDPHQIDEGTWQHDAVNHWHKCANCDTHVGEEAHKFVDHVCSDCAYAAKKVTLTFALGYEGETIGNKVCYADDTVSPVTLPTPKARPGYTFEGWMNGSAEAVKTYTVTFGDEDATVDFTAKWKAIEYTVKFDVNKPADDADIPAQEDQTVTLEEGHNTITLPQLANLGGYDFGGWTRGSANGQPITEKSLAFTAAMIPAEGVTITFYARWNKHGEVTVSFEYGGWTEEADPASQSVPAGQTITFPEATVTRKGYTFEGWRKSGEPEGQIYKAQATLAVNESVTFEAVWKAISYTLRFTGGTVNGEAVTVTLESPATLPTPTDAKKGYEFKGWQYKDKVYTGMFTLTEELIPADGTEIVLTAVWSEKSYTVKFASDAEGAVLPTAPKAISLKEDEKTVTLTALTLTGYKFLGWFVGEQKLTTSDNGTYTFTLTEANLPEGDAITFTAKWEKEDVTVTFQSDYGAAPEAVSVKYGESITLSGYTIEDDKTHHMHFLGWALESAPDALLEGTYKVESNVTLKAVWEKMIGVTFQIGGQENQVKYFVKGYTLTDGDYPEAEKEGYRFDGWLKDGEPYMASELTENITLTAKFVKQITVTYYDENGRELSEKKEIIDENTAATNATNADKKGYTFAVRETSGTLKKDIWESAWYLDTARGQKYEGGPLQDDTKLYRKWVEDTASTLGAAITQKYLLIGNSNGASGIEFRTDEYDLGLFRKDTTLARHTVYTVTAALKKDASFRFKIAGTAGTWDNSKDIGFTHIRSAWGTTNFSNEAGKNDNNIILKTAGVYQFILVEEGSNILLAYEKLYDLSEATEEGYYLVGSMTNWAGYGCKPIYLGSGSTADKKKLIKDVEITQNDLGIEGVQHLAYATAKVVVGHTYKNGFFYVSQWNVITSEEADTNYHFPDGTGTFRVTFTVTSSVLHTGTLKAEKHETYTYTYDLGSCNGVSYSGTPESIEGGSVNSLENCTITLPAAPVWGGYRFKGWLVNGSTHQAEESVTLTGSVTITAQWIKQIKITFGKDGGSVTIDENTAVGAGQWKPVPDKTGYKDGKWMNGGVEVTAETSFSADTTLEAAYTAIGYTLKFENDRGTAPINETVTLDAPTVSLTGKTPTMNRGYDFEGWTMDEGQTTISEFTLTEELIGQLDDSTEFVLKAKWAYRTYTLRIVHEPALLESETVTGSEGLEGKTVDLGDNSSFELPAGLTRSGYTFGGWFINSRPVEAGAVTLTAEMIADEDTNEIALTAKWAKVGNVTVTFDVNSGERGQVPESVTVGQNSVFPIPGEEPTRKGYTFKGWYIEGAEETLYRSSGMDGTHPSYELKTENVTFKAKWEVKTYSVAFHTDHGALTTHSGTVSLEQSIALETLSEDGWDFGGWEYNGTVYTQTFTLTADMIPPEDAGFSIVLTAKWTQKIAVVWHVLGQEETHTETYSAGKAISETDESPYKPAKAGYLLDGWYEEDDYSGNKFKFNEPLTSGKPKIDLYARFYKETVTVKFYAMDKTTLLDTKTVSGLSTVESSTKYGEKRFATFAKWLDADEKAFSFDTVLLDDVDLHASWTEKAATKTYYKDNNTYKVVGQRYSGSTRSSSLTDAKQVDPAKSTLTLTRDTFYEKHNVFTIELDLYVGDWFQITHGNKWDNQFGYGFLDCEDGTFLSYDPTAGSGNIVVTAGHAGRYRITLITVPTKASQTEFGFDGAVIVYEKLSTHADSTSLGTASTEKIRATGSNIDSFGNNSTTHVFTKLGVVKKDLKSYTVYYLHKSLSGNFKFTNGAWSNAYQCDYWKWENNSSKGGATGLSVDGDANFVAASAKVYRVFYFVADDACEHVEIMDVPARPATK